MATDSHSKKYRPMLIGFAGRKNSGKGTACAFFEKHYQYKECAFADPLKFGLAQMFSLPLEYFTDTEWKERVLNDFGFSPRQLMQSVGTEGVRALSSDAWLVLMDKFLRKIPGQRYCIGDIRMENEAEFVRKRDGLVVHLVRGSYGPGPDSHSTEAGLKVGPNDLVINNDGTLQDLNRSLGRLATHLGW